MNWPTNILLYFAETLDCDDDSLIPHDKQSPSFKDEILQNVVTETDTIQNQFAITSTAMLSNFKLNFLKGTSLKPYQCDICQKNFPSMSRLKRHYLIHTGERPYQCQVCDKRFRNMHHVKGHMRCVHKCEYIQEKAL